MERILAALPMAPTDAALHTNFEGSSSAVGRAAGV